MTQYIDKSALIAEIERLKADALQKKSQCKRSGLERIMHQIGAYNKILSFLDTLEVKEVDSWHKQSEEDIDDSFNDWSLHRFICLMKDGSIQEFTAIQDECYDGSINLHLDCVDDEYNWEYDDIMYWIEIPNIKAQK